MFVSFFGLDAFTSRSLARGVLADDHPLVDLVVGPMKSEPRSCRFWIANPVAGPRRSATRLPVGRVRSSPCHGS